MKNKVKTLHNKYVVYSKVKALNVTKQALALPIHLVISTMRAIAASFAALLEPANTGGSAAIMSLTGKALVQIHIKSK